MFIACKYMMRRTISSYSIQQSAMHKRFSDVQSDPLIWTAGALTEKLVFAILHHKFPMTENVYLPRKCDLSLT